MRLYSISILLLSVFSASVLASDIYVEDDARLSEDVSNELAIEFAKLIQLNGYSCNSVSGVAPSAMSGNVQGGSILCWLFNQRIVVPDNCHPSLLFL
ncbi:hypothetical protein, partial [Pseudaeromonas pectinilytica]